MKMILPVCKCDCSKQHSFILIIVASSVSLLVTKPSTCFILLGVEGLDMRLLLPSQLFVLQFLILPSDFARLVASKQV